MNLVLSHIFDVYTKEVRSLLELAVPVWHSGLTLHQAAQIERVQKTALRIILEDDYITYNEACSFLDVETLDTRRDKLCLNFAKKEYKKEHSLFRNATLDWTSEPNPRKSRNINAEQRGSRKAACLI